MFNLLAANLHNGNVHDMALLVAAAEAFDLSVTLRHVSVSVDSKKSVYRYRSKMAYSA